MRKPLRLIPVLLILVLFGNQCSKDISGPEQDVDEETIYNEAIQLSVEIDNLEEIALTGSTKNVERHFRKAMHRLNGLLERVGRILRRHENDAAKVLFAEARDARGKAVESAKAGNFEEAFDFVKESRYFAVEALKLVKDQIQEEREQIIQRLQEGVEAVKGLLGEIEAALPDVDDERVQKIYDKANLHFEAGQKALDDERLRRAGFHLREAGRLAHLALRIINDGG